MDGPTKKGKEIEFHIDNMDIVQTVDVGNNHNVLATLAGKQISLHCGNADFTNSTH
jgi:hypothetical protein